MQRISWTLRNLAVSLALTSAFVAALVEVLVAVPAARAQTSEAPAPPKFRLPGDVVVPLRYAVDLTVVTDQDTFTGVVDIELNFKQSTSVLWLNAEKLKVQEATLTAGGATVPLKIVPEDKDYVGFAFASPVGPSPAELHVSYQGEISRKDMQGIFQVQDGGEWYVFSQFENIGARQAFPCFDEPGYKVPWQLTLHVKKDQVALSNTPMVSETESSDGMKTVKFAETPPLPSYLVALTVGHLEFVDAGTAGKKSTHVRIVVPHGRGGEAKYAAETTPAIVNLLEDYFGIPYPYDKLDEVAIPLAGYAMEHPGLVTYGAGIILVKPDEETLGRQRGWASVAAHELAHQWFGDLVTTAWWDDIWLNEGFASWMANKIVNKFHPEWHMDISELNSYQGAMENDSLVSARRVRQPIESKDDIANAFDGITYNKGSALLNMFESYMGPDRFREGVRRYLAKYAWKNATSAEFLASLAGDDASIAGAFSSFLDQPGVPLVTADLDCQDGEAKLHLAQQRFLPLGSQGGVAELWKAPVCVRYPAGSDEARECLLLDQPSRQMALPKATGCPAWVQANGSADGYYRVLYRGDLLGDLFKNEARALTLPEKVALIGDIAALTGNGSIPLGRALALVPEFARDPERQVVVKTTRITTGLENRVIPADLAPKYHEYLEQVYGGRARQLGWKPKPGEGDNDRLLRPDVVTVVAIEAQDPDLVAQAKTLALAWLDDHHAVDPEVSGSVLVTAAKNGDRAFFDRLRAAAKREKNEDVRRTMLFAMGLFPDPEIIKEALSVILTDEFDSRQSLDILFGAGRFPGTRDLAYDFLKQNWDALVAKLPTDYGAYLPDVVGGYCDEAHRRDAASFFEGRSTKYSGGPRNLAQMLEGIDLCVAFKKAQQPSVTEFLKSYGTGQSAAGAR
ncbi:MAG TPA: M1 family metallopeptidase [Terriglobia bacterium]|nr:M1 family metallopeptidase [Terriglobia bacterium]